MSTITHFSIENQFGGKFLRMEFDRISNSQFIELIDFIAEANISHATRVETIKSPFTSFKDDKLTSICLSLNEDAIIDQNELLLNISRILMSNEIHD